MKTGFFETVTKRQMVANTFSEEYIFFQIFKSQVFLRGQFRKSPGLICLMPAVRGLICVDFMLCFITQSRNSALSRIERSCGGNFLLKIRACWDPALCGIAGIRDSAQCSIARSQFSKLKDLINSIKATSNNKSSIIYLPTHCQQNRFFLKFVIKYLCEYESIFESASACSPGDPGVLFAEKNLHGRKSHDTVPLKSRIIRLLQNKRNS
jgi:hypothetical protein